MDLSIDEVLSRLRGEPGTQVTITIKRGGDYVFDVTLTRAIIQVPTVRYEFLPEHKVGILRIIQFTPHTPEKVEEAISAFKEQGYRGLLIDVRSNPGGLLDSVLRSRISSSEKGPYSGRGGGLPTLAHLSMSPDSFC